MLSFIWYIIPGIFRKKKHPFNIIFTSYLKLSMKCHRKEFTIFKSNIIFYLWYIHFWINTIIKHFLHFLHGSAWNTSGCSVENFTNSQVICSCNHLTNFAILLSLPDEVDIKVCMWLLVYHVFIECEVLVAKWLGTILRYTRIWSLF